MGLSALALKRQLGFLCNTAWSVKHKVMQAMKERDDKQPLSGFVLIDYVYWGSEQRGGKKGRGSSNKTPFVVAVSLTADGDKINMLINEVKASKFEEISRWASTHFITGSTDFSEGLACFNAVKNAKCEHIKVLTSGGPS
jgi:hypothetical protein